MSGSDPTGATDGLVGGAAGRRQHSRMVTSVLSEVFSLEGTSPRYVGPGVVLDVSETGLALAMDDPPREQVTLLVKNAYFDVQAQIVNRTPERDCTRLGMRFVSKVTWYRPLQESTSKPASQRSSLATSASSKGAPVKHVKSAWYERYELYKHFLTVLDRARRMLPVNIRDAAVLQLPDPGQQPTSPITVPVCRWHEDYRVGVEELDLQHERLIDGLNELAQALSQNNPLLLTVFDDLVFLIKTHCDDEELFMGWHGYPELDEHRIEHKRLLARLADIRCMFLYDQSSFKEEVLQELVWRMNSHVKKWDQGYVQYLAQIMPTTKLSEAAVSSRLEFPAVP